MEELIKTPVEDPRGSELHDKPLLAWLAKSIFIDTVLDFFMGIIHFLIGHIKLLADSFRFVWKPFHDGTRKEAADLMRRSQAVFGFLLTVLGFLIFLVKVNAIDEPDQNLSNQFGNEKVGLMLNLVFFLILAASYYVLQALLLFIGRLYRYITSPAPNIASNDMIFIHMGNQVFILGALGGMLMRLIYTIKTIDTESGTAYALIGFFIFFAITYLVIFSRLFWNQKQVPLGRKIAYIAAVVIVHGLLSALISTVLVFFYVGV